MPEGLTPAAPEGEYSEKERLFAGVWVSRVSNGDSVEIGGANSLVPEVMDISIEADFDFFEKDLQRFTPENVETNLRANEEDMRKYFETHSTTLDVATIYLAITVQRKVRELLKVGQESEGVFRRSELYQPGKATRLSETVGKSACSEQALLGKYLLQKLGINAAFVNGVVVSEESLSDSASNEAHAYIAIADPKIEGGQTIIFDIARPITEHYLPGLYRPNVPFSSATFKGKRNVLVESTLAYLGAKHVGHEKQYFGIGSPNLFVDEEDVLKNT